MPILTLDGIESVALAAIPTILVAWYGHKNALKVAVLSHEDKFAENLQKTIDAKDKEIAGKVSRISELETLLGTIRGAFETEISNILAQSREERARNQTLRSQNIELQRKNEELEEQCRKQTTDQKHQKASIPPDA